MTKLDIDKQWIKSQGEDVVISVIDTGCDLNHTDIRNNLLPGKNFIDDSSPQDDNGHGSHVCGTIAAENNSLGMVGVAPRAKIIPVKALGKKGQGTLDSIIKAIIWSADQKVDFITMSLGGSVDVPQLSQAIDYANSKGCIVFAAAGNSGENSDLCYPAKYKNVISTGAIDENFERTKFSCSGEDLDFLAPGHNIFSLAPNNNYAIMSGTSMSNPYVTGCAALLLAYNRRVKKYSLKTYQDYINILSSMTIKLNNPSYQQNKYQGNGIVKIIL
ncbi:MAG: serine protease [Caulobacteraceae bacterium]|nr:serine protease [Caulobacteraceae bacterium]